MSKKLYLFDFDGTITHKDSLFEFLKFANTSYYIYYIMFVPIFILSKLKLIKKAAVKEKFIAIMLKGKSKQEIEQIAQAFFESKKQSLLKESALEYLNKIKHSSDKYLVSASLDIWLKPFAELLNLKLICTKADYQDGVFTGKFATPNCNNEEKKKRILKEIKTKQYTEILVFGDTSGDKKMYELGTKVHHKYFL